MLWIKGKGFNITLTKVVDWPRRNENALYETREIYSSHESVELLKYHGIIKIADSAH